MLIFIYTNFLEVVMSAYLPDNFLDLSPKHLKELSQNLEQNEGELRQKIRLYTRPLTPKEQDALSELMCKLHSISDAIATIHHRLYTYGRARRFCT
jgi:hypothetical protein